MLRSGQRGFSKEDDFTKSQSQMSDLKKKLNEPYSTSGGFFRYETRHSPEFNSNGDDLRLEKIRGKPKDTRSNTNRDSTSEDDVLSNKDDYRPDVGSEDEHFSSGDEWRPEPKSKKSQDDSASETYSGSSAGSGDDDMKEKSGCMSAGHKLKLKSKHGTHQKLWEQQRSKQKRQATPRHRKKAHGKNNPRKQKQCVVEGCTGFTINLYRHLEQVHKDIPKFDAVALIKNSNLKKTKRTFPKKKCCFPDCKWVGTRPDKHIHKQHNLEKHESSQMAKTCHKVTENVPTVRDMHTADSLSDAFYRWFSSLEGGNYILPSLEENKRLQKETQNKKIRTMVKTILDEAFGGQPFSSEQLLQLKTIGRSTGQNRASVVERIQEGKTWGTVKNYLSALSHFYDFVEACYPHVKLDVVGMRTTLKGIIHSVNKFVSHELQKRKLRCRDSTIPAELMSKYLDSRLPSKYTKMAMDQHSSNRSDKDVERARNHVILLTALTNGKRSGAICDMKCSQVRNAKTVMGGRVVLIEDGKTFRTSGAAGVFFDDQDFKTLENYIQYLRPITDIDQVFCQITGEYADASNINNYLQQAFNEFGMTEEIPVPHITCSIIRKTLVSLSRDNEVCRETQISMAKHMDHSIETADRHYDTTAGLKCTAKFATVLQGFLRREKPEKEEMTFSSGEDEEDPEGNVEREGNDLEAIQQSSKLYECSAMKSPKVKTVVASRFGRPEVFSKEDRERIQRVCSVYIRERVADGAAVKCQDIVNIISNAGINFQDLFTSYTKKQIYNRVRLEIRAKRDKVGA